jgi:glutathione synthase/RimK-type ligase-like ATP-grasp enzyme
MSASWLPYLARERELNQIDSRVAATPDSVEILLARARLLTELGRIEEAKSTYLKAVTIAPTHFDTLNHFGKLLLDTGFRSAARTLYLQAIQHHPDNPIGYTNLGNVYYKDGDLETARQYYEKALELSPHQIEAHRGLSYVLRESGDEEGAKIHRKLGFAGNSVIVQPYRGKDAPIAVLQIISGVGGNLPLEQFLSGDVFFTSIIVADYFDLNLPLPVHNLLINAIADADLCMEALDAAEKILSKTSAPLINSPLAVGNTSRASSTSRLGAIPGVISPKTIALERELLTSDSASHMLAEKGFDFPLLLRSPGFHTGQYFLRVENSVELAAALPKLPGKEIMVIQFLDARSKDGKIRKYRVMMIDGKLYPLHLAISHHWMIHYFSADMSDNAEHRSEDKTFLENMQQALGEKAMAALHEIQSSLGLDYAGIDFSLSQDGDIILFEANAAMNVIPPGRDERWDYRRPHVQRIIDATREMLIRRAKTS